MMTPLQTLTALGQRTFTISFPEGLTNSDVPASVAASEPGEDPPGAWAGGAGGLGGEPGGRTATWYAVTLEPVATNSRPPAALGEAK
jgi:hypothetical protein